MRYNFNTVRGHSLFQQSAKEGVTAIAATTDDSIADRETPPGIFVVSQSGVHVVGCRGDGVEDSCNWLSNLYGTGGCADKAPLRDLLLFAPGSRFRSREQIGRAILTAAPDLFQRLDFLRGCVEVEFKIWTPHGARPATGMGPASRQLAKIASDAAEMCRSTIAAGPTTQLQTEGEVHLAMSLLVERGVACVLSERLAYAYAVLAPWEMRVSFSQPGLPKNFAWTGWECASRKLRVA